MENKHQSINEMLKTARRAKGLTQSGLASAVGCKQSAISMFEAGRSDALSSQAVVRIAEVLGIDITPLLASSRSQIQGPAERRILKYCPMDECPSNVPYAIQGRLIFKPSMVEEPADAVSRCRYCGEIMEERCPSAQCGAELSESSSCPKCGALYVSAIERDRGPLEAWADAQRIRIKEIRELSQTKRTIGGGQ
jgi:transcriptional regulator with XRE-family HTH domain